MGFLLIKTLHFGFVTGSYALFLMRGIWSMYGSSITQTRWIRIVPHVIDTLLLISATALAIIIHQYPFVDAWLAAQAVFAYIVLVAITHKPFPC